MALSMRQEFEREAQRLSDGIKTIMTKCGGDVDKARGQVNFIVQEKFGVGTTLLEVKETLNGSRKVEDLMLRKRRQRIEKAALASKFDDVINTLGVTAPKINDAKPAKKYYDSKPSVATEALNTIKNIFS